MRSDESPGYHPIDHHLLLFGGAGQIDAGGLHIIMPQQICQQCNVVITVKKIDGKAMAEGMRIDCGRIDLVAPGIMLQPGTDAPGG